MIFPYRTHISLTKIEKLTNEKLNKTFINQHLKPYGFYYSIKDEWYIFFNNKMEIYFKHWLKYIYEVKLNNNIFININDKPDTTKILLIKNIKNIDIFIKKYCNYKEKYKLDFYKLRKSYGGIEIHNPHKLALQIIKSKYNLNSISEYLFIRNNFNDNYKIYNLIIFLLSLDVSGGCIWDINLIKYIKLINTTK
jgi:hypothetical protein